MLRGIEVVVTYHLAKVASPVRIRYTLQITAKLTQELT